MMKAKILTLITLLAMAMTACSDNDSPVEPTPDPEQEENVTPDIPSDNSDILKFSLTPGQQAANEAINASAISLLADCCELNPGKNMSVSPVSVSICLAMVANAVDDANAQAIAKALGYTDLQALNELCAKLLTYLPDSRQGAELLLANSLWYHLIYNISDPYTNLLKETFGAEIAAADFDAPATVDLINKWCSDNTNGKIDQLTDELNGDVCWINALYFAGMWDTPFDKSLTHTAPFNTPDGVKEVDMMHRDMLCNYTKTDVYHSVSIYFKGENIRLTLYLPDEGKSLQQLLSSIDSDAVTGGKANLHLDLPKFNVESEIDMTSLLQSKGVATKAVDLGKIGIPVIGEINLKHKTATSIDEDGATMAAVTAVLWTGELPDQGEPIDLTLKFDRPFVYTVTNVNTGSCIMAGYVANP